MASIQKLSGLDWPMPDLSTLCRGQKLLAVQLPYRGSGGPLYLLIPSRCCKQHLPGTVDSTGIKVRSEGEWHARKLGSAQAENTPN